jgi:hypothetical protein
MTIDPNHPIKQLVDATGFTQAVAFTNQYILMEVVRSLARSSNDPRKYLSDMFEMVSARNDRTPLDKQSHPVNAEMNNIISQFFVNAGKGII